MESLDSNKSLNPNTIPDLVRFFPDNPTKEQIEKFKREFATQENILQLLQEENRNLLRECKEVRDKIKELEVKIRNLESKNGMESTGRGFSEFSVDPKDDIIKSLRQTVHELNLGLNEAEKIKNSMQSQLKKDEGRPHFKESHLSQNVLDHKASTSLAYQHRLITQLRETIGKQQEEINILREKCLRSKEAETALTREEFNVEEGDKKNIISSPHEDFDLIVKRNEELELLKGFYENRIRQLEEALIEKDKSGSLAVEKLICESGKIRSYYENAIKTIIVNQKSSPIEQTVEDPQLTITSPSLLEDSALEKRILELETKIFEVNEGKKPDEGSLLAEELVLLKAQKDKLLTKLNQKNKKLEKQRMRANRNLIAEVEKLRAVYTKKINELEEKHRDSLKSLSKTHVSKEFEDKLRKKWFSLKKDGTECFISAVIDRLIFLEKYCVQKDMEMELNLRQVLRIAEMERNLEKEKAELCIEEKNIQIREFQCHLDSLLRSLRVLKGGKAL